MKWFNNSLYIVVGMGCLLLACKTPSEQEKVSRVESLPYYNDPSFTPRWFAINNDSIDKQHKIPQFTLINQLGDTITEKTFRNKIYIADFFFTSCPGICSKMTSNMLLVQEAFKSDNGVLLLSHSVTPKYDSVPILKYYAEAKGVIANKWHLATGVRKDIYDLGRFGYFIEENLGMPKGEDDFLHTENFILVDKNSHIRGIYNGLNNTAIAQLVADIKTLKKEK